MSWQPPSARPELADIRADYHGALNYAELSEYGIAPETVLDFSVNSNPFGPSDKVRVAIANTPPDVYPDRECLLLRTILSEHLNTQRDTIVVGNGAAELLWFVAFAYCRMGDQVLVIGPTFGEYARNAQLMGAVIHHWTANEADGFMLHPDAIAIKIGRLQPRLVHLCNPNNPTGQIVGVDVIATWATQFPNTLFVIDEAYLAFAPNLSSAHALGLPNILVVRSMTKDYALAGVRLGYALGHPDVIAALYSVRIPWSVSAVAQVAGIAALEDHRCYQETWRALRTESQRFREALQAMDYPVYPSCTHYFLLNVGNGAMWRERLLLQGVLVRLCDSFGLPHCVRIATRTPQENNRFLKSIQL
jgi:histidinol-phosphate aminotransferase